MLISLSLTFTILEGKFDYEKIGEKWEKKSKTSGNRSLNEKMREKIDTLELMIQWSTCKAILVRKFDHEKIWEKWEKNTISLLYKV